MCVCALSGQTTTELGMVPESEPHDRAPTIQNAQDRSATLEGPCSTDRVSGYFLPICRGLHCAEGSGVFDAQDR